MVLHMKNLIKTIQKDIPFAKDRMFSAIINPERYNLWDRYPKNPDAGRKKSAAQTSSDEK